MTALAQTQAGGAIDADTLWQAAQGPYIVNADIVIGNDAVLTIEPGTVVYMNAGVNLIVNNGSLRARGNASHPIIITAASDIQNGSPFPGNWGQIVFRDGTNDGNTIVEWAQIRYGSGLRMESASPTLNHVTIRNHTGAAIGMDLKSSPAGTGISAAGNTVNGISVPSGEIADLVNWRLQGIPYVISQGEVSVGKAPVITGINPSSIQAGMTTDAVITGMRLDGVKTVNFDVPGISAIVNAGASDTAIPVRITAVARQPTGNMPFEVQTAAGRIRYQTGVIVIPTKPTITVSDVLPATIRRGEARSIQITGTSLQGAQITPPAGLGLSVSNVVTNETQATFNLAASSTASLGTQPLNVTNLDVANSATASITVGAALPLIYTNPATLVVSPSGNLQTYLVMLSNSDSVSHTLNLSTADPTIATVSPASITIPAGSTQIPVGITGLKLGTVMLNITSPTLAPVSVQVFVTNALSGALVGPILSPIVGLERPIDASSLPVGMVLGSAMSPMVGLEKVMEGSSLPAGMSLGPIVSPMVGLNRPIDASSLPVGMVLGSAISPMVGLEKSVEEAALPAGTSLGPVISPVVGVEN